MPKSKSLVSILAAAAAVIPTYLVAQTPSIVWMRGGFYDEGAYITPAYSSDGQYLIVWVEGEGSIKVFQVSSGLLLHTIVPFGGSPVWSATLSADSTLFAASGSVGAGSALIVYSFSGGILQPQYTLNTPDLPGLLSFSPDDSLLGVGSNGNGSNAGYFTLATWAFTPAFYLNGNTPEYFPGGALQFTGGGIALQSEDDILLTGPPAFPWANWESYGFNGWPTTEGPGYVGGSYAVYTTASGCPESPTMNGCYPQPQPVFVPRATSAAFSPNGAQFAAAYSGSSSQFGTLQTFTPVGPPVYFVLQNSFPIAGYGTAPGIAYSPDSSTIAVAGPLTQTVAAANLSVTSTIIYDWRSISSVAYSPDGTFAVSGGEDGQAIVWNAADGSFKYKLQTGTSGVYTPVAAVSISPNSQLITVAGLSSSCPSQGTINVYSASTGMPLMQFCVPIGSYLSAGFLNDSQSLVVSGGTGLYVYSALTGAQTQTLSNPCGVSVGQAVFPNGTAVALNCSEGVFVVNLISGAATAMSRPQNVATGSVAVSPDSTLVAIGFNSPNSPVRSQSNNATTGAVLQTYSGNVGSVWSIAFSSDSQTVVGGDASGLLNFWDASSGTLLQTYNQETGDSDGQTCNCPNVTSISYSSDNQHIYYGRDDASSVLMNNPIYFPLATLNLSANAVIGGAPVTGTVTITTPAPAYGAKVILTTSDPAAASVPSSVMIPSGQASATFSIGTTPQAASAEVNITANSTGTVLTDSLTVLAQPELTALTLSPRSVTGGEPTVNNTVSIGSPAPSGGVTVALHSAQPSVAVPPASVLIPEGATLSPAFTISTDPVSAESSVSIAATYNGVTKRASMSVTPPLLAALTLSPKTVAGGRPTKNNTVILSGPAPAGGIIVNLTSSNTDAATVPAFVTVPQGSTASPAFTISTKAVVSNTVVSIGAASGGVKKSANLTVLK